MILEANIVFCTIGAVFANSTLQTTDASPATEDIQPADVAAIVLGCLLLVILIGVLVVCILIQKGQICVKQEVSNRIHGAPDFSSTPFSLKTQSFLALQEEKENLKQQRKTKTYKEKEPTIYMYEDIYHPPKSRPLPGNGVKAEPYVEHVPQTGVVKKKMRTRRTKSRGHGSQQTQADTTDPDMSARVFITTSYKTQTPYSDKDGSNRK